MTNGFVSLGQFIPDVLLDMRYYGTYNFVGTRIDGYESPCALLTWEAAAALAQVSVDALALGFELEEVQRLRAQGIITKQQAHELRESVYLMQMTLGE